jgi:pilus assembly protein CpaE
MLMSRPTGAASKIAIAMLTADAVFEQAARATFGTSPQIDLRVISGTVASAGDVFNTDGATVVVIDLDTGREEEFQALARLMSRIGTRAPVVVITQAFDEAVARRLLQMRVADFIAKPVQPIELVRTCARVAAGPATSVETEAQITTFLPAVGGAGVTTLAIQTALLLLSCGPRGQASTCLVDLDFQHGACADYLDLEPRLDLKEIEPRPERLDRQLLEVMISRHTSGLAVIAAPNRPAEMRTFDPDMVTRLLDLVSSNFNYVVIDMPRTWFSWTDNVLLGSNKLFIVSEMTIPSLRQAKQLVSAIRERLGEEPQPQVIVNRFEQRMFATGLKRADVKQALGEDFVAAVPNNYRIVREAIDRGIPLEEVKPGNQITAELKRLVLTSADPKTVAATNSGQVKKLTPSWAR